MFYLIFGAHRFKSKIWEYTIDVDLVFTGEHFTGNAHTQEHASARAITLYPTDIFQTLDAFDKTAAGLKAYKSVNTKHPRKDMSCGGGRSPTPAYTQTAAGSGNEIGLTETPPPRRRFSLRLVSWYAYVHRPQLCLLLSPRKNSTKKKSTEDYLW